MIHTITALIIAAQVPLDTIQGPPREVMDADTIAIVEFVGRGEPFITETNRDGAVGRVGIDHLRFHTIQHFSGPNAGENFGAGAEVFVSDGRPVDQAFNLDVDSTYLAHFRVPNDTLRVPGRINRGATTSWPSRDLLVLLSWTTDQRSNFEPIPRRQYEVLGSSGLERWLGVLLQAYESTRWYGDLIRLRNYTPLWYIPNNRKYFYNPEMPELRRYFADVIAPRVRRASTGELERELAGEGFITFYQPENLHTLTALIDRADATLEPPTKELDFWLFGLPDEVLARYLRARMRSLRRQAIVAITRRTTLEINWIRSTLSDPDEAVRRAALQWLSGPTIDPNAPRIRYERRADRTQYIANERELIEFWQRWRPPS